MDLETSLLLDVKWKKRKGTGKGGLRTFLDVYIRHMDRYSQHIWYAFMYKTCIIYVKNTHNLYK